jgi:SAM-dependent methyltransferase
VTVDVPWPTDQAQRSLPPGRAGTDTAPTLRQSVGTEVMYRHVSSGLPSWIGTTNGRRRPLPMGRWLGGESSTPEDRHTDAAILRLCSGPTIDVGCGPGRFTAALTARGVPTLGVDISTTAVEMTIARGGAALRGDVFGNIPGCGEWAQVLLADGNIGIGGDPLRMLSRARELIHRGGTVIAEIDSLANGMHAEDHRWESNHFVGSWFRWSYVGHDTVDQLARSAGLVIQSTARLLDRGIVTMGVEF